MNNYSIKIANDAMVSAHDVDGKKIEGIKKQLKQAYRWSSGTVQCMYCERRNMLKSKRLFYTTIAPGFIEALMYSISLILIPLFLFVLPSFAIGFLISDTLFSLGATLFIIPKKFFSVVARYPGIFFFKYLNSAVFISAVIVVSFQAIRNQKEKWSNEWKPL
jgi:hypothetical protein